MTHAKVHAWIEGARLRTLPAAAAPVAVGTAAAVALGAWRPLAAALALVVALSLQVGVNYANDYSDGIRGTDSTRGAGQERSGPPRLTGGGIASPRVVLAAALGCFGLAGLAGVALLWLTGQWWLLLAGAAAVVAAWFYTGGRNPYGYMGVGLSEIMVFVFFGLMACVGTTWTQALAAPWWVWVLAASLGLMSVAMLIVNNLRDEAGDRVAGKRTIVVRLGRVNSLRLYAFCMFAPAFGLLSLVAVYPRSWELVVLAVVWGTLAWVPVRMAYRAHDVPTWVRALKVTGLVMLAWALLVSLKLLYQAGVFGSL